MELTNEQQQTAYNKLKEIKLAILIPDDLPFEFKAFRRSLLNNLEQLLKVSSEIYWYQYFKNNKQVPEKSFEIKLFEAAVFRLDLRRDRLVLDAMEWGATHLLFMDTDQTFLDDVFFRLARHDLPIVGGLYFYKKQPFEPHLYTRTEDFDKQKLFYTMPIYRQNSLINKAIIIKENGLQEEKEIHASGLGCMLFKREVFEKLGKPPFFKFTDYWDGEGKKRNDSYESEDLFFFDRIKDETDYKIWIDTSCKCGHIVQPLREVGENNFAAYNHLKSEMLKNQMINNLI